MHTACCGVLGTRVCNDYGFAVYHLARLSELSVTQTKYAENTGAVLGAVS